MSTPEVILSECTRSRCSFKYRMRWFHSKGAFLVLISNMLISASVLALYRLYDRTVFAKNGVFGPDSLSFVLCVPFFALIVSAPLSGWLADARLGNYKVLKLGYVLIFSAAVVGCLSLLIFKTVSSNNHALNVVIDSICVSLICVGLILCLATSLQVG